MKTSKTCLIVAILFSCCIFIAGDKKQKWRRSKRNHKSCRIRSLVRYQMTVNTEWDQETFPKMFPMYRPPAHWSQLIGRSHSEKYEMWREGHNASLAVESFVEGEDTSVFGSQLSQGYQDVLDAFIAPEIQTGIGETSTVVTVDGQHSKVSFMMKIVPSPDWFIGLDSTDLCYRGRWKKKISRDLLPFDAGTDRGLTFTAPNWDNEPKETISAITASSPDHPASSFFYPEYKVLPRLAYVEFKMISEYRLKKVYQEIQQPKPIHINRTERTFNDGDNVKPKNENNHGQNEANKQQMDRSRSAYPSNSTTQAGNLEDRELGHGANTVTNLKTRLNALSKISNDASRKTKVLSQSRKTEEKRQTDSQAAGMRMEKQKQSRFQKYKRRQDCQVSEWSQWSSCSKTCGFGNKRRSRTIITQPNNGGQNCPLLNEEMLCGSMRNCKWSHFNKVNRKVASPMFSSLRRGTRQRSKYKK